MKRTRTNYMARQIAPALLACIMLIMTGRAVGHTWYVDAAATGMQDGCTWADAFTTLTQALNSPHISSTDTIHIAQGTYRPTTGSDRTISFTPQDDNLRIRGGYKGVTGLPDGTHDDRNIVKYRTILSGDLAQNDAHQPAAAQKDESRHPFETWRDNSYHVIDGRNVHMVVFDGVTISHGAATEPDGLHSLGAGALCGGVLFKHCTFEWNIAQPLDATDASSSSTGGGGALACDAAVCADGPIIAHHCTFVHNVALRGSAIWIGANDDDRPRGRSSIVDCTFRSTLANATFIERHETTQPHRDDIRQCTFNNDEHTPASETDHSSPPAPGNAAPQNQAPGNQASS
jgi:hypothetical protein